METTFYQDIAPPVNHGSVSPKKKLRGMAMSVTKRLIALGWKRTTAFRAMNTPIDEWSIEDLKLLNEVLGNVGIMEILNCTELVLSNYPGRIGHFCAWEETATSWVRYAIAERKYDNMEAAEAEGDHE